MKKIKMSMIKPVIVQMGEHEIMHWSKGVRVGRPYTKILICPKCFNSIHLGRYSENEKWTFEKDDTMFEVHTLHYKTEREFKNHIKKCVPVLNSGINRIDRNSDKKAHCIVDQLAKWSRRDVGWDFELVVKENFLDEKVCAYVFVNEVGPISYVAFKAKKFNLNILKGRHYVLWDMYTFPFFRKKGIATRLVTYGVEDLNIDTSLFPVSYPWKEDSKNIIRSISTNEILAVLPAQSECFVVKKDEV